MCENDLPYTYKEASESELARRWDINIANNKSDDRWKHWKTGVIADSRAGKLKTFVVICGGEPVGEGSLIFRPDCFGGNQELADGSCTANINALRMDKAHEGRGHMSKLVRLMEHYAAEKGYQTLTIGVEARETRNLAIYLHWGYTTFVKSETEDGALVLYYAKQLS